jgi:hypothetical protein
MIIRDTVSGIRTEYAAAEAAKRFDGEYLQKWASETKLKVPKMLKGMLVQLADKARWQQDMGTHSMPNHFKFCTCLSPWTVLNRL